MDNAITWKKCKIGDLSLSVSYVNEFCDVQKGNFDPSHIHPHYEIYINGSGDVSFMHGTSVYSVEPCDAIISYPGDLHYCIYNSSSVHEHWCVRFECEDATVLDYLAKSGLRGFIRPAEKDRERIIDTLFVLSKDELSDYDRALSFITLLSLLKEGTVSQEATEEFPERVSEILAYIDENLTSIKTTDDISQAFFISNPTLDRLFRKHVHLSVHKFLEAKRLSLAESLLKNGATVTEACYGAGFSDCSRFIAKFKEKFGKTPLKYKDGK